MAMRKKLRNEQGTTFVEMLAAVLVLIFLSLMINTGLNLGLNAYRRMISHSECQVLLSTAADTLINELRFARDMEFEADTPSDPPVSGRQLVSYRSRSVGCVGNIITWNAEDSTSGGTGTPGGSGGEPSGGSGGAGGTGGTGGTPGTGAALSAPDDAKGKGQLYVKGKDPRTGEPYILAPLLASGAYGAGGAYQVCLPKGISYDEDTKVFTFQIQVYDGDEVKAEGNFSARCLSGN